MSDTVEVAQRFIAARNARDREALLELFAPDGVMHLGRGDLVGHEGLATWLERMAFGTLMRIDVDEWRERDGVAVGLGTETYVWVEDGSPAGEPSPSATLVEVRDGRVVRFWPGSDIDAVLAEAGLSR